MKKQEASQSANKEGNLSFYGGNERLFNKLRNRSIVIRKGIDWSGKILRSFKYPFVKKEDYQLFPPVIANSFPKSGTHLLYQILEVLPQIKSYGTFLPSVPAIPHKKQSKSKIIHAIGRIIPNELIRAHLCYNPEFNRILKEKNAVHFFIYRDLRDVAVSEANFLTYRFRWHSLHRYFKAFQSDEDRISFSIEGASNPAFPYWYPNIAARFRCYQGWIKCDGVFAVKFEDLKSERCENIIRKMVNHYCKHTIIDWDIDQPVNQALANIQPTKSHTFRKGEIGGWKKVFTKKHKKLMKSIAGQLLIDLGYEKDLNW